MNTALAVRITSHPPKVWHSTPASLRQQVLSASETDRQAHEFDGAAPLHQPARDTSRHAGGAGPGRQRARQAVVLRGRGVAHGAPSWKLRFDDAFLMVVVK